jgi:four helix bundle protein
MDLAVLVHEAARKLPTSERYELGREMRRSATSIPSNVAEGFSRHSRKAYRFHVAVALGSTAEVETQLELAQRLSYLAKDFVDELLERCATVARIGQGFGDRYVRRDRGDTLNTADSATACTRLVPGA